MQYLLCRIEDDSSTTEVSQHDDLLSGIAAGQHAVDVEDWDFAYCLQADGVRVATFGAGRVGYREWCRRTGRLQDEYIHSLDDRYDHDIDQFVG